MHPGWLTNSEAVVAEADRPEGPYRFKATVLPPRGAQWWDGRMTHNPRVIKTPEGYALFYTGVSHPLSEVTPGERLSLDDPRVTCARAAKSGWGRSRGSRLRSVEAFGRAVVVGKARHLLQFPNLIFIA